jgi:hypothetical protein
MEKLTITKKPVYAYEIEVRVSDETEAIVSQCYDDSNYHISEINLQMAKSHSILLADSINTYQQCETLPSELLRQRDEVMKALKQIKEMSDPGDYLTALLDCKKIASETLKQIENGN